MVKESNSQCPCCKAHDKVNTETLAIVGVIILLIFLTYPFPAQVLS